MNEPGPEDGRRPAPAAGSVRSPGDDPAAIVPGPSPDEARRNGPIVVGAALATAGVVAAAVLGGLYETGTAPFSGSRDSPKGAIADAARMYVDAMNSQQVGRMRDAVCPADSRRLAGMIDDGEPVPHPVRVQSVSEISVDGDTATGTLSVTADGDDGQQQNEDFRLGFERDGTTWKVCQAVTGSRDRN